MAAGVVKWVEEDNAGKWVHRSGMLPFEQGKGKVLQVNSWNVAAVNNNPFEYWLTYDKDPRYKKLMADFEAFIDSPEDRDVPIAQVFPQIQFDDLEGKMKAEGWTGVDEVVKAWETDFKSRTIIKGFLKDKTLGKKRLIAMPDRITNMINPAKGNVLLRPTVINAYLVEIPDNQRWWAQWRTYLFDTMCDVGNGKQKVCSLLSKIPRKKYPTLTAEEEEISIPLQTLCLAIFDAILVHVMNVLAPDVWSGIKKVIVDELISRKPGRVIDLICGHTDADIFMLQESAGAFVASAETGVIGTMFHIVAPAKLNHKHDQNSLVLLSKARFGNGTLETIEFTDDVLATVKAQASNNKAVTELADGDLIAIAVSDKDDQGYVLASFHGDTNGLASIPVLKALSTVAKSKYPRHKLMFGCDANTCKGDPAEKQSVSGFVQAMRELELSSCWGPEPNELMFTTFNARTFVQPQLQKATRERDIDPKNPDLDANLKDFIIFRSSEFVVSKTTRDNTGDGSYQENVVFPTLTFPSDHALVRAKLTASL